MKDLGGLDLLIYSGVIEDEFIGWKEAVYACFYTAVSVAITKNQSVENSRVATMLKKMCET